MQGEVAGKLGDHRTLRRSAPPDNLDRTEHTYFDCFCRTIRSKVVGTFILSVSSELLVPARPHVGLVLPQLRTQLVNESIDRRFVDGGGQEGLWLIRHDWSGGSKNLVRRPNSARHPDPRLPSLDSNLPGRDVRTLVVLIAVATAVLGTFSHPPIVLNLAPRSATTQPLIGEQMGYSILCSTQGRSSLTTLK